MTESNWRAQRRAELWERLYAITDELLDLVERWEQNDPEMACWDREAGMSAELAPTPHRNKKPRRPRKPSVQAATDEGKS